MSRARRDHRPVRDSSPASLNHSEQLSLLGRLRDAIVNARVIVVGLSVRIVNRVVIVWLVVEGVVWVVIPGVEAVLETYPKASVPGPPMAVPEVSAAAIPIAMPIPIFSC